MMLLEELQNADGPGPQDYRIYVDLDGVMADFTKGVDKIIGGGYSEERYEADSKYRSMMWKAVGQYQKQGGELWLDLDPMPDAHILWKYIAPYEPEILSATGNPEYGAAEQKHKWVAKNIGPDVTVNLTRKAMEKAHRACENCILIDDKEKAINPWEAAGGIGILHTSAADTIAKLKQLGL